MTGKGSGGSSLIGLLIAAVIIAVILTLVLSRSGRQDGPVSVKRAAVSVSGMVSLRAIVAANRMYMVRRGAYADALGTLAASGNIDELLGGGKKSGYSFTYTRTTPRTFECYATPADVNAAGRSFFTDESGVIRATDGTACKQAVAHTGGRSWQPID